MIIKTGSFPNTINTQQNQSSKLENINKKEINNSQKIKTIKKHIDNGTYKIDLQKIAEKIAQDLLLESKK